LWFIMVSRNNTYEKERLARTLSDSAFAGTLSLPKVGHAEANAG
jgi:hypothetical protein